METRGLIQTALVVAAVCLSMLPTAHSIHCYQCNSKTAGPDCQDLANSSSKYYLPCESNAEGMEPFCRKRTFKLLSKEGSERVVRSCGWERYRTDCYMVDDDDHSEVVCQCFTDGCNSAPLGALPTLPVLLASTLIVTLLLKYYSI